MSIDLRWLGHGSWGLEIATGGATHRVLVDPFLDDSPTAPVKAGDVAADFILISHGHFDHISDAAKIAKRTGAVVISNYEICQWLEGQGVKNTAPHNLGGGSQHAFGRVMLTPALHSSVLPDGTYGGNPSGFLITADGKRLYFACDTALTYDMKLIGELKIDVAVVPIGDLFTMGPDEALRAVKLIEPKHVLPSHYNTWPPIAQDPRAWADQVRAQTRAEPHVLAPGEQWRL
jgi:L-ascorbate metabolism protein UlaG (beta-lactamase superfamily)